MTLVKKPLDGVKEEEEDFECSRGLNMWLVLIILIALGTSIILYMVNTT
jgi:hypothetical protein